MSKEVKLLLHLLFPPIAEQDVGDRLLVMLWDLGVDEVTTTIGIKHRVVILVGGIIIPSLLDMLLTVVEVQAEAFHLEAVAGILKVAASIEVREDVVLLDFMVVAVVAAAAAATVTTRVVERNAAEMTSPKMETVPLVVSVSNV